MASSEPSLIAEASSEHGVEATLYSDHVMYVRFPRGIVVDVEAAGFADFYPRSFKSN